MSLDSEEGFILGVGGGEDGALSSGLSCFYASTDLKKLNQTANMENVNNKHIGIISSDLVVCVIIFSLGAGLQSNINNRQ